MQLDLSNLPATILATATPGTWPLPAPQLARVPGNPDDWRLADPSGRFEICRLITSQAPSPEQARANAFMLAEARTTWQLALQIASRSYDAQSADLIDAARGVLRAIERRARDAYLAAGEIPAPTQSTPGQAGALQARDLSGDTGRHLGVGVDTASGPADMAAAACDVVGDTAPPGDRKPDTVVLHVDTATQTVCQRICYKAEGMALIDQAVANGTTAILYTTDNLLGIELVLELFPKVRGSVKEALAKVRRDYELVKAMDRNGIPRDRDLRANICHFLDDIRDLDAPMRQHPNRS